MLAGADAVGLNFYDKSARSIDLATAQKVAAAMPSKITKVGVFVNASASEIRQAVEQVKLDVVQLHGDEPPEFLAELSDFTIVRSFRFGDEGTDPIRGYLEQCAAKRLPDSILVDARHGDQYGGTGKTFDWEALAEQRDQLRDLPLILAGGLTPFNVAKAIALVRPDAVDTASGVESELGHKDPVLVRAFATSSKKAFAAVAASGNFTLG